METQIETQIETEMKSKVKTRIEREEGDTLPDFVRESDHIKAFLNHFSERKRSAIEVRYLHGERFAF